MQPSNRPFQQPTFINKRIVSEEQAIGSQIRRFKQNYLNKVINANNLQTFIRFSKQLHLLLISHCKNIVCIAPDKISNNLEELSLIFDDIINKYHQVALKINDRSVQISKNDSKTAMSSQLCSVCSQQIKKVHIDQMRRSILNEAHNIERDNEQPKNEEEDLQFFSDLNDLLNHRHGELLKNQIEIDMYQDVALNALKSLSSLKTYFSRESVIIPNNNWIEQARVEMQAMLKQNFNGKIPPWIEKMFAIFWAFHRKQTLSKQKQEGVQTTNNANNEILQLKKKIYRTNEKLEKSQNKVQAQQHDISTISFEKKDLQIRVDYYKKQLNKLLDEIQAIKSENQSIKLKLSNNFDPRVSQSMTKTEVSYYQRDNVLMESSRSKKRAFDRQNSLPKILNSQDQKRSKSKKRDSQTSIKMYPLGKSQYKTERDHGKKKSSRGSNQDLYNKENQELSRTQPNSPSLIRNYHNEKLTDNVIQEQEGEAMLQEEKKRIVQVSDHIKNMVKHKAAKNGFKHYFSNSVNSDKFKDSLRRIPRRTNKMENPIMDHTKISQKHSIYKNIDDTIIQAQRIENTLIKIYHYLRNQGLLVKMSEQQFKESIAKIDLVDMAALSSQDCQKTLQSRLSSHHHNYQRLSFNRKSWNQETFHIDKETIEQTEKPKQELVSKYFSIFSNQQNAYNYELSLTKNHYKGVYKMSKLQEKICQQFYDILIKIKNNDISHYKFFCSFLRYPYQVIKNDFGVVNMVNEMKFDNFHQYFQRLLGIHIKCKKQEGLCEHFVQLRDNLMKNVSNQCLNEG